MNLIGICIIVLLTIVIYLQYKSARENRSNLIYISRKLNAIISDNNPEKLLLVTDDPTLKDLIIEINRLLDSNRKVIVDYTRTEASMKMMLANISHDLRTPLTVVLGYIETLLHRPHLSADEKDRLLAEVQDKAKELLELIQKFFDLAKLESGDKNIPLTRVNMNEVCRKSMLLFYNQIQSEEMEAVIEIPDARTFAYGNEEALERILNNLISNAIRYGTEGKIVGLTLRQDEHYIFVDVWDQGKGITEKHKDLIFERMYTLEDSRNKLYQGSGLGLTITKRLVEKMRGNISLRSKPYEKTIFTVQLQQIHS
ncbi:sensor histidine kinase [Paenibacillus sp. LMG 31458]|uniref:histidine kinase n=1 Tax=Paenibacillus phytorum TaxID=2654977 RepID=A0ABX1Y6F8_9BACL|nr:sensor histidine kinase [Paenibacillus phytorum]NOU75548.1 sensor histidine kinase [Paenibacillus phytorum]